MEWRYHYAGIEVASSLELPEWAMFATAPTTRAADVVIRHMAPSSDTDCATYTLVTDRKTLTFNLPQIGRYSIHSGTEIGLTPCTSADTGDLLLFLLGSAWGALSYQRGWFPLHASIVQVEDEAVAFCAPSGGGKSSLAAWLVKQGYPLFSDDLCRLDVTNNQPPRVWRSAARLKLWQEALQALDWPEQPLARDQRRVDKFHLRYAAEQPAETLPLRALYILTWGDELTIQSLAGLRAVQMVIEAATYRPEFVVALGQTAQYWQSTIDLVGQIPIFTLQRPRAWALMPLVGESLLNHIGSLSCS